VKSILSFAVLLLVSILILCELPAQALPEADTSFLTAESLVDRKKHQQAIPYFDRAVQLAPNVCRFRDERGLALLELEEREKALADFSAVIKLNPHYGFAYRHRSRCYFELGNLPAAIADITTAISFETTNLFYKADLLTERSTFYLKDGKSEKALADLTAAIALTPKQWIRYEQRGEVYAILHQYQKAVDDYNTAFKVVKVDRAGKLYGLYGLRARAYEKLGRKDLAAADYKKASEGYDFK